ncbi:unnamed protein product, partial [Amoebophrya sp. A25]
EENSTSRAREGLQSLSASLSSFLSGIFQGSEDLERMASRVASSASTCTSFGGAGGADDENAQGLSTPSAGYQSQQLAACGAMASTGVAGKTPSIFWVGERYELYPSGVEMTVEDDGGLFRCREQQPKKSSNKVSIAALSRTSVETTSRSSSRRGDADARGGGMDTIRGNCSKKNKDSSSSTTGTASCQENINNTASSSGSISAPPLASLLHRSDSLGAIAFHDKNA